MLAQHVLKTVVDHYSTTAGKRNLGNVSSSSMRCGLRLCFPPYYSYLNQGMARYMNQRDLGSLLWTCGLQSLVKYQLSGWGTSPKLHSIVYHFLMNLSVKLLWRQEASPLLDQGQVEAILIDVWISGTQGVKRGAQKHNYILVFLCNPLWIISGEKSG